MTKKNKEKEYFNSSLPWVKSTAEDASPESLEKITGPGTAEVSIVTPERQNSGETVTLAVQTEKQLNAQTSNSQNKQPKDIIEAEEHLDINAFNSMPVETVSKRQSTETTESLVVETEKRSDVQTAKRQNSKETKSLSNGTEKHLDVQTAKRQKVTYYINPETAKQLRLLAVNLEKEYSELADEAIKDLLIKYGCL